MYCTLLDYLDKFIREISSLQNAYETRNVVVTVLLVAESVEHDETNGVDVTHFTVGQQTTHFLHSHMHQRVTHFVQSH